jgi:2-keto-3-deoxy-L-rhamnonate aldolase RhmA
MGSRIQNFRARLTAGAPLSGTFLKTPSPIVCEVLALAALDVVCLDAEHAPFGRMEIDGCLAALRAADQPSLVRVAECSATEIRSALDCGAGGILAPHVSCAEQARAIVAAARFGEGGRGYSGATRAGGFGDKAMRDHIADSHSQTAIIVQIEDTAALEAAAAIAAVPGVDCLFVGRVDLAVAMGKEPSVPEVEEAARRVCAAARTARVATGVFTTGLEEVARWRAAGASLFLFGSDQSFVLTEARRLATGFHARGQ